VEKSGEKAMPSKPAFTRRSRSAGDVEKIDRVDCAGSARTSGMRMRPCFSRTITRFVPGSPAVKKQKNWLKRWKTRRPTRVRHHVLETRFPHRVCRFSRAASARRDTRAQRDLVDICSPLRRRAHSKSSGTRPAMVRVGISISKRPPRRHPERTETGQAVPVRIRRPQRRRAATEFLVEP